MSLLTFILGTFFGAWLYSKKETVIAAPIDRLNKKIDAKTGAVIDDKSMRDIILEDTQKKIAERGGAVSEEDMDELK